MKRPAHLLRGICDRRKFPLPAHKWRVRLDEDTFRVAIIDDFFLLAERLEFDLVHLRCFETGFSYLFKMLRATVSEASS